MELMKRPAMTMFLVFLLVFLLVSPSFCQGRKLPRRTTLGKSMKLVYEIDYRGPETHTFLPPPDWYGRSWPHDHKYRESSSISKLHGELSTTGSNDRARGRHGK
ncbi:hypothetical protein Dimus_034609 [Dionaea muscipula]